MPRLPAKSSKRHPKKSLARRQKTSRASDRPRQPRPLPATVQNADARFRAAVDQLQDGFAIYAAQRDASGNIVDFTLDYINDAGCRALNVERDALLGKTLLTIYPHHLENGLYEAYCQVVQTGNPLLIELPISAELFGTRRISAVVNISAAKLGDGFAVTWRDVTDSREQQVRVNAARTEALVRVAARLNAKLDLNAVLAAVCEQAAQALNAPGAWVNLYNPDRAVLDFSASFGIPDEFSELYVSPSRAIFEQYIRDLASPLVIPDAQSLRNIPNTEAYARADIRTVANATMRHENDLIGVLCIPSFHAIRDYTQEELTLLQGFADIAAQAIVNARLHERVQNYGAEMERRVQERTAQLQDTNEELQLQMIEREHLVAQLDAERNRWKATVESMLDPVTVADAQGHAIYMNPAYSKMVERQIQAGLDLENHPQHYQLYKPDGTLFGPEELPLRRAALFGDQVRDEEIVQLTPTGDEHIAIWNAAPIRDAQGHVAGAVAIGHEITAQRRMEKERGRLLQQLEQERDKLREASERITSMLASITDSYFVFDREWRFVEVNPKAARHFGKPREELVGRVFWELFPHTVGSEFDQQLRRAMQEQAPVHFEALSKISSRWLELHAYPSAQELTVYFRDISERKDSEQAIRELNLALERRATELEVANQELEAFSYSVSHDLRTPLHSIKGFAQLLLQDHIAELSPTAKRYLELVSANAQAMIELVNALLNLSRTHRQPLRKQPVEPVQLVRQALEEQRAQRAERQIQVEIGDLPPCNADPVLLKQVFVNLISNAIKFTRTRPLAQIEIGTIRVQEASGMENAYFVRDNGVGFDMVQADKLFSVFQRLHSAEDYEGTGIGLATAARIIHRHGGRVWAEAESDRGAAFYFTLG